MRLHRFFINMAVGNKEELSIIDADLGHQLKNVFRLRAGDKVILFDGSGYEYMASLSLISKEVIKFDIEEKKVVLNVPKRELTLYFSLIKKDNAEWILEKGTELGVSRFVPIVSERSEKKDLNMERAWKIVKEASEQSGRGTLPVIDEVTEMAQILVQTNLIAFHLEGQPFKVEELGNEPVGILIGPEGGWSEREIELLKEKNVKLFSLGSQVLRAETAVIAASTLVLL